MDVGVLTCFVTLDDKSNQWIHLIANPCNNWMFPNNQTTKAIADFGWYIKANVDQILEYLWPFLHNLRALPNIAWRLFQTHQTEQVYMCIFKKYRGLNLWTWVWVWHIPDLTLGKYKQFPRDLLTAVNDQYTRYTYEISPFLQSENKKNKKRYNT